MCDNRDNSSESVLSPCPPSSLTYVHRFIGYHNPNWYSLSKSERLMYLSVYDNRDRASESSLSPSPLSSLTHVHRRCIGYRNPNWYSLTKSARLTNNPNWYSLPKPVRLTNLSVYDNSDSAFESALLPSPPSSLMLVHRRCIGHRNPSFHSLSKSARLTNSSVYDSST